MTTSTYTMRPELFLKWTMIQYIGLLLQLVVNTVGQTSNAETYSDYCLAQTFEGRCNASQIILMESAFYGRMRFGVCEVTESVGYLGCYLDILELFDSKCSGRQSCSYRVIDLLNYAKDRKDFSSTMCPKELHAYLEVKYSCISVLTGCVGGNSALNLPPGGGYINSGVLSSGININEPCMYRVTLDAGRRARFVIYDFTLRRFSADSAQSDRTDSTSPSRLADSTCGVFLNVIDGGVTKRISLCNGNFRERHLYTSQSNEVEFYLTKSVNTMPRFLIQYHATGCAYFEPPANTYVTYEPDLATVVCNFTGETWFLTCGTTAWLGTLGNCTKSRLPQQRTQFPWGIVIAVAIGVGIGLVVGLCLLGMVCLCRRWFCPDTEPLIRQPSQQRPPTRPVPPMNELITQAAILAKTRDQHGRPLPKVEGDNYKAQQQQIAMATIEYHGGHHGNQEEQPKYPDEHIYESYKYRRQESGDSDSTLKRYRTAPSMNPRGVQPRSNIEYAPSEVSSSSMGTSHPIDAFN